jgi:phosphatidylserine synthase 2
MSQLRNHQISRIKRTNSFYDDGTVTFFWRKHSILVLILMLATLTYVSLLESQSYDKEYNTKR